MSSASERREQAVMAIVERHLAAYHERVDRQIVEDRRRILYLEWLVADLARRLDLELPNEPNLYLYDPLRGLRRSI